MVNNGKSFEQPPTPDGSLVRRTSRDERRAQPASHDHLTGLPNRASFMNNLWRALACANSERRMIAVLFMDLDDFKVINDTFGHARGDALLAQIGQRLAAAARTDDTVARFGGDEFVALAGEAAEVSEVMCLAERFLDRLRQPFVLNGHAVSLTASIGVSLSTPGHSWPNELLREADVALYQAKAAGKARVALYEPAMADHASQGAEWGSDLGRAVERNELQLFYQPEVDLRTGAIHGMEALIRWRHPHHGIISPTEFISLAEHTGLVVPISRWVIDTACHQAARWQALRPDGPPPVMGVNLSARQFQHPDVVEQIARVLHLTGLAPSALRLEITESVLMKQGDVDIRTLQQLRDLGVRLAIDDFGTGYSSLTYLQHFTVDTIKIDQSFVRELVSSDKTVIIVRAIIMLAHDLGMDVVAEGIETAAQLERLRDLGCDRGQGYYFWKPLGEDELGEILSARAPDAALSVRD